MNALKQIQKVTWDAVSAAIRELNPQLFPHLQKVARNLPPGQKYLLRSNYGYGQYIIEGGLLKAPCTGDPNCNNACSEKIIKDNLQYSEIPLCLITQNNVEVTQTVSQNYSYHGGSATETRQVPLRILHQGALFGLFEVAKKLSKCETPFRAVWNVAAGSRSIMINFTFQNKSRLHKAILGEMGKSDRNINWESFDKNSWEFVSYVDKATSGDPWNTSVLFFPGQWVTGETVAHQELQLYLFKVAFQQYQRLQNYAVVESKLNEILMNEGVKDIKLTPHYVSLYHLLLDAQTGALPVYIAVKKDGKDGGLLWKSQEILAKAVSKLPAKDQCYPLICQPEHLRTNYGICSLSEPSHLGPRVDPKSFRAVLEQLVAVARSIKNKHTSEPEWEPWLLHDVIFYTSGSDAEKFKHEPDSLLRHKTMLEPSLVANHIGKRLRLNHPALAAFAWIKGLNP